MGWLARFRLVISSSLTALIEKFEDPERSLHQLIIDMEEELERVRASVAGVIADEIQLGKQVESARKEAREWEDRARQALGRADEAAARAALNQKLRAAERADSLDAEFRKQQGQAAKLHRAVRDLEDKIRQARHKKALLIARLARAESSHNIQRALDQTECRSAFAQFHRLEERVERAEAMEKAYDRLHDREPEADDLKRQFEDKERRERLEREFNELKKRLDEEDDLPKLEPLG